VIALVALAVTIAGTVLTYRQGMAGLRAGDTDVDRQAQDLARAVLNAETKQRVQLLSAQDRAIDVAFTFQPAPAHNADGAAADGTLEKVVDYFRALQPQRLVLYGEPTYVEVIASQLGVALLDVPQGTPWRGANAAWGAGLYGCDPEQVSAGPVVRQARTRHPRRP
jgi:hypothetical protein